MTEVTPVHTPGTPTQVAHPWKATLRTLVANLLAALAAWPLLVSLVTDTLGPYLPESWVLWLGGSLGVIAAVTAFLTRLMASEWAQRWLVKVGLGTGVEKEPAPVVDSEPVPTPVNGLEEPFEVPNEGGRHRGDYLGG